MLIPLIGVFLSQSRSHCSPRLYPVAFDFIILFCLLVIQRLNDTREAFLEDLAPVTQVLMPLQLTKRASHPPHLPFKGHTSVSLHYDTFVDKVFWEVRRAGTSVLIFLPLSCGVCI